MENANDTAAVYFATDLADNTTEHDSLNNAMNALAQRAGGADETRTASETNSGMWDVTHSRLGHIGTISRGYRKTPLDFRI